MPEALVRLNGSLSKGIGSMFLVSLGEKRVPLKIILSEMTVKIPEKVVAFLAIKGMKAVDSNWVKDGDVIDIFPVVAGG